MKKSLSIIFFIVVCTINAFAQIGYGATYNRQQQSEETSQSNTQILTTTAYSQGYDGQYAKMRIRVQITDKGFGGVYMRVVEKYVSSGLGGQWAKIYSGSEVKKCAPLASMNPIEQSFMYKATIDTKTWYFDL